jgi:branched-chain amino acid transport system permease protein
MQALYAQLLVGLINGSFYALLSLGLAVIFGMLNIINFAHGALYMMGAFCAYFLLSVMNIGYWPALIIAPIAVGIFGMILERTMLQWLSGLDHLYGLLLTFGIALIVQGVFQNYFGSSGLPYAIPDELKGGMNLGFMFLPIYRGWVVVFSLVVCLLTWYLIERTRLGANLRAATENPTLVRAFGINVPRMITLTYGRGVVGADQPGPAADGRRPDHRRVRGGGDRRHGFHHGIDHHRLCAWRDRGIDEILLSRSLQHRGICPHGAGVAGEAFGTDRTGGLTMTAMTDDTLPVTPRTLRDEMIAFGVMTALLLIVPLTGVYPFFVMQALCFALLACAFNLLIGYGGLLSFGHAMFLGTAGYITAHALKVWGFTPELGILIGTAGAAGLGVITGLVAIRRQGIYFAMITLALSQLLYFIYLQTPFTHGEDGIQGIPQGFLFGLFNLANPTVLYYVILAGFLFGFLVIFRTINSPFGEVLKSIRENEQRAISLGYKTDQYKLLAYILSGTLAGFAGSLKVFVAQNASLTDVHWTMSGEIVLMTLVGGLGTVFGPVVGAFVIIAMQQYLAGFGQWVTVIQGVIFVVCVLTFRRGVIGEIAHYFRRSL